MTPKKRPEEQAGGDLLPDQVDQMINTHLSDPSGQKKSPKRIGI